MPTRAVFFDLGGTLLVMRRDRIISRVLTDAGFPATPQGVHSAYFRVESSWLSIYGEKTMSGEETEEAYRQLDAMIFRQLYPGQPPEVVDRVSGLTRSRWPALEKVVPLELYPDAIPTLERLKSDGHILGLVSNAPPDTRAVVERLGLPKLLSTVVISGVVGVSKPNPAIFRIALKDVGVSPPEAVHVGDVYEADVVGARNAGMRGILVDRDDSQRSANCLRVHSLTEIPPYLV